MTRLAFAPALLAGCLAFAAATAADDPTRVTPEGQKPPDARLGKVVLLDKDYFPFNPPATKDAWNTRRQQVREQVLVATGLWPMPEKTPLKPVVHGKIPREGYTVEKVFFASMPGHYVTGNLYRPTAAADGKRPGVLCPHGHWANGRFYDAGEKKAKAEMDKKAETRIEAARYPLQARCVHLARMGCVVFHYDMVGNADSKAIPHAAGFADVVGEQRSQNAMGLQTWNSVRALDFLVSLPDVDPKRIGVTGASGGGTQTFILGAIDDRPTAAFPAVMVSTAMQGGCICENCSYLRIGTGNVEIAGLFAPKPLAMSGADDWTKEIEKKGLPELKALYGLLGAEDKVAAKCWPEFEHNYNQPAREMMYAWFNRHLFGATEAVKEKPFTPVPPKELSVFNDDYPMPKDAKDATALRVYMTDESDRQMAALAPKDAASLAEFRRVVGTALRVMTGGLPGPDDLVLPKAPAESKVGKLTLHKTTLSRKGVGDAVPAVGVVPEGYDGSAVVIWVHPQGKASLFEKGEPVPAAKALLDGKMAILGIDAYGTGEYGEERAKVNPRYAGYTYGYNRPLLAERVHDVLTAVAFAKRVLKPKQIHLVGWEAAGPWVVIARAQCDDAVARTAADLVRFEFETMVKSTDDPMMLPGAVKYGGLPAFLALCAPGEVLTHNHQGTGTGELSKAAYAAAGAADKMVRSPGPMEPVQVAAWLLQGGSTAK